ncbi:hypothetical protein Pfo_010922 [Paulownia fortunei]|nr:hypothetical protein Pfo_010922 [Paulownia fortunei]
MVVLHYITLAHDLLRCTVSLFHILDRSLPSLLLSSLSPLPLALPLHNHSSIPQTQVHISIYFLVSHFRQAFSLHLSIIFLTSASIGFFFH